MSIKTTFRIIAPFSDSERVLSTIEKVLLEVNPKLTIEKKDHPKGYLITIDFYVQNEHVLFVEKLRERDVHFKYT